MKPPRYWLDNCFQTVGGVCDLLVIVDNALYVEMDKDVSLVRAKVKLIVEEANAIFRWVAGPGLN